MKKHVNLIGKKFGRLVVLERIKGFWVCKCDCGNIKKTTTTRLLNGDCKSCGCLLKEIRHKLSKHPLYSVWHGIKTRCLNEKIGNFHLYGGRGIKICEEWKENFIAFYEWSVENNYKKGYEIDRIDNNDGYYPDNCRYVTGKKNSQNQNRSKYWVIDGKKFESASDAAKFFKVSKCIIQRWCKGYYSELRKKHYLPKQGCYSFKKYGAVDC